MRITHVVGAEDPLLLGKVPSLINRVAMDASAHVIVDASPPDGFQGLADHAEGLLSGLRSH